jgi:hypothetical protein
MRGLLMTSLDEIGGWKIDHANNSISKEGHVIQIKVERQQARLGGQKLPFGTRSLKPRYGSLFKPEYDDYVVYEDGKEIYRDRSSSRPVSILYEYFNSERAPEGMPVKPPSKPSGAGLMGMIIMASMGAVRGPRF